MAMPENPLYLRQIHPSFVHEGRVTSQAFRPTPKDESQLSVYHGGMISAEGAFRHFTEVLNLTSVGVMGVLENECTACGLSVTPDPATFPEHYLINFSGKSSNEQAKLSKKLRARAEERGWLFQPVPQG